VQLGPHVPNTRTHISKAPNIRAITGLEDVRAGSTVNVYKACGYAATVQLQCSASTVDHSPSTVTMPGDPTARRNTTDQVWCGRTIRPGVTMPLKILFATSSR
jgi:hypothetical protein